MNNEKQITRGGTHVRRIRPAGAATPLMASLALALPCLAKK
ncbi:MAG: hypothetical protein WCH04_07000 [Gammaproteobacteria bacterium]